MSRPLACICFGFLAARLLCAHLPLAVCLLPAAFCAILPLYRKKGQLTASTLPLRLAAAGVVAAVLLSAAQELLIITPVRHRAGREVTVTARVETAAPSYQDGMCRGILTIEAEEGEAAGYRVYTGAFPAAEPGDRFSARMALYTIEDSEYRLAYYADGAFLEAEYLGEHQPLQSSNALKYRMTRLSRSMAQTVLHTLGQPYAGLISAMSIGDASFLSEELSLMFRRAGISHLLVVSGLHVTLASRTITGKRDRKGRFQRLRALLSMIFTVFLMGLVGMTPSVIRAGIAMLITDLGCFLFAAADPLTSLGIAGALLCMANPYAVCDLGFQLSFCACLGLLVCGWVINRAKQNGDDRPLREIALSLLGWVLPSVFAALFTLPVQLLQGLTVSGASVVGNLLTTWLSGPITIFGLLACGAGLLPNSSALVKLLLLPAGLCAKLLIALAKKAAALPFAVLPLPRAYTLFVLAFLAVLILLCVRLGRAGWLKVLLPVTLCTAGLFAALLGRDVVTIELAGASNNSCAVIRQNGQAVVLFRGGAANWNRVREQLAQQGIDRPDLVLDLRQEPSSGIPFDAEQVIRLEDLGSGAVTQVDWQKLQFSLMDQEEGNLVLLDAGGYLVAMHTGHPGFFREVRVDLLLAPSAVPQGIVPAALLTDRVPPEQTGDAVIYCGFAPAEELRPGRSVRFLT